MFLPSTDFEVINCLGHIYIVKLIVELKDINKVKDMA